jgi:predicted ATP-dependent protease
MDRTPIPSGLRLVCQHDDAAGKTLPFDAGCGSGDRVWRAGAEDQDQLSTRFGSIADLIHEAAHRASKNSHDAVTAADVQAAEEARRYRQNLVEERLQESMVKGTVLLDTAGAAIGRINGLSVISMGDYAFGHPSASRPRSALTPGRSQH